MKKNKYNQIVHTFCSNLNHTREICAQSITLKTNEEYDCKLNLQNQKEEWLNYKIILEQNYNLAHIELTKNQDSSVGNVYNIKANQKEHQKALTHKKMTENNDNIKSNDEKYILKIYDNENHAISMEKLFEILKNKEFYVPTILSNKNNQKYTKVENKFFMIYSYLEGSGIGDLYKNIPDDISKKLANELRRFHNETAGVDNIGLENISQELVNIFANTAVNNPANNIKAIGPNTTLRKSILHFDLTKDNIFYNQTSDKIGFIDFDDAKYGESIIDVAILISLLYFSKKRGANIEGAKTFINEYYKNDFKNKKIELKLIKQIAIKWIDLTLEQNSFEPSTNESFEIKKKLIENIDFEKWI